MNHFYSTFIYTNTNHALGYKRYKVQIIKFCVTLHGEISTIVRHTKIILSWFSIVYPFLFYFIFSSHLYAIIWLQWEKKNVLIDNIQYCLKYDIENESWACISYVNKMSKTFLKLWFSFIFHLIITKRITSKRICKKMGSSNSYMIQLLPQLIRTPHVTLFFFF